MYICKDCKKRFLNPYFYFETHGLDAPPYERRTACPFCRGENIKYIEARHCKCCGARLRSDNRGEYCSKNCKKRGEKLWRLQAERIKARFSNPIEQIVRAVEEYNKKNGTRLSYGQYVATVLAKEKKNEHRAKA